jgi:hypothetical protein
MLTSAPLCLPLPWKMLTASHAVPGLDQLLRLRMSFVELLPKLLQKAHETLPTSIAAAEADESAARYVFEFRGSHRRPSEVARFQRSYASRMISTFSPDIAYSDSPTASSRFALLT